MATGQTKLTNMINPQVMADMINGKLASAIKIAPLAVVDTTLQGRPGNTITVPSYAYIGPAEDVAEGVAMGTTVLTASSTSATVKKAGKAVEITDEAVLSGYGDPIGEANNQLTLSVADKIDEDSIATLNTASLVYDGSSAIISYNGVVNAVDKFVEEGEEDRVILVHPNQVTQLRLDPNFIDKNKYGADVMMTGAIGMIAGCQVVKSKRVKLDGTSAFYLNPIVKRGGLTIYLKRQADVETDRDILKKTTVISVDEHYTTVLSDASKVVVAKFKKA